MKRLSMTLANLKAIMDGSKTVTRRPVNPQPPSTGALASQIEARLFSQVTCCKPPYHPGEVVGISTEHRQNGRFVWDEVSQRIRCEDAQDNAMYGRIVSGPLDPLEWTKKSAPFMPAWACVVQVRIESVRAERLRDISDDDCELAGCIVVSGEPGFAHPGAPEDVCWLNIADAYRAEWESIYGARYPWADTWVWRIEFRREGEG